jgi:hypothetical protein
MHRNIKFGMWLFGSVVLLYVVAYAGFYLFQDKFIFQSESLSADHVYQFDQRFEEYAIPTADGEKINALLFKADSAKFQQPMVKR